MKKILYPLFAALLMCMASCEKEVVPVLIDMAFDEVTESTVNCQCTVQEGGVEACGFYYGTSKSSVANRKSSKVVGTFEGTVVSAEIAGLDPNTTYYIMGYAMNEKGEGVTGVVSVKTASRTPQPDDNLYPGTTDK